jgi:signal transduction histidine kinase
MINRPQRWNQWAEILLAWVILLVLLFYTYLEIVQIPYIGFNLTTSNGMVTDVFVNYSNYDLQPGDVLISVNDVVVIEANRDLRSSLFPLDLGEEPLRLQVQRADEVENIEWPVPGFNRTEFLARIINTWWLGFFFWVAGLATLLLVRPLDSKRRLFSAFFFLTALWLVIGNTSRWGHADSRIIYRMALLLSVPVLIHLHWLFPRSLGKWPTPLVWSVYGLTTVAALLQWADLSQRDVAALAFAAALFISFILLFVHYWRQPETRASVRLLLFALFFTIVPMVGFIIASTFFVAPGTGNIALISLPIIPGAYFYSIYRYQLGGSEFRANRLIATYLFLILLGTTLFVLAAFLNSILNLEDGMVLLSIVVGLLVALTTIYGFPPFQRLVERRLLAMPLPPIQLIDAYLARITTTLTQSSLTNLLTDEVLPSLLVRQSALYRVTNNQPILFYADGVQAESSELEPALLAHLLAQFRENDLYHPPLERSLHERSDALASTWVRLALALKVEGKLSGIWLLGRHDPDDVYSPAEISTLQTLARQTALALSNIEQSNRLQALYQANIDSQEAERTQLAYLLHDEVLNQAAILYMSLDAAALSPRAEAAYETLKQQVRQMISSLRPPALDLGLHAALEELADELDQRAQPDCTFSLKVPHAMVQYPPHIENHLFRIVQLACENAMRHAHARHIQISGTLAADYIDLYIEDDGKGFTLTKPLDLTSLLTHKHFGLVHMVERAEHIQADFGLDSAPGQGTRIHLTWSGNGTVDNEPPHEPYSVRSIASE